MCQVIDMLQPHQRIHVINWQATRQAIPGTRLFDEIYDQILRDWIRYVDPTFIIPLPADCDVVSLQHVLDEERSR